MSSPTLRYRQARGLRLRPVPELGTCVVFVPEGTKLLRLNPHAWLLLELCRDAPEEAALRAAYLEAVVPPLSSAAAAESLRTGLDMLLRHRLVEAEGDAPAGRAA